MAGQWPNFINFLTYLAVSLPLLGVGVLLFMATTPYKENRLLAGGAEYADREKVCAAQAVALDLGGKILGMAVVIASAVYHAVSLTDLVVWGLIGAVFQIIVFYLFELITPYKVIKEIPIGNVAVGILSAFVSVASGLIMAALIS